jgi:5-formyltetrahydrofolate cyclo-ligase
MTKGDLRREMQRRRAALDSRDAARASIDAQRRLCAMPVFLQAKRIGVYLSKAGETATGLLVEASFAAGYELAVPAQSGAKGNYRFCRLRPGAPLRAGPLGIGEPAEPEWVDAADLDLIVVPGVAFDPRGRRLGHGLGCYDRLLAGAGRAFKAGLCFEWQITPEIPAESWDVNMDAVVTDLVIYGGEAAAGNRPATSSGQEKR